jgi:hypothetical protein
MTIDHIIAALTAPARLPVEAITAADSNRAAALPAFLREIERYIASTSKERRRPSPLFMIVHLLGAWRETSAYRPMTRLFALPSDDLNGTLGDAVAETSHRIMAGVFDGDPEPLRQLILNGNADGTIRARMCEALAMAARDGAFPADSAGEILRASFNVLKAEGRSHVWIGWQQAVAMLGLEEMKPMVVEAFERGFIDPRVTSLARFDEDLRASHRPGFQDADHAPLDDVIAELSRWHSFFDERG